MTKKVKYFRLKRKLEVFTGDKSPALIISDNDMTALIRQGYYTAQELGGKYKIDCFYCDEFVPFPTMAVLGGLLLVSGILSLLFIFTI